MALDLKLDGKVAIITGGCMGLGGEAAKQLAEQGAKLALVSIPDDALEAKAKDLRETFGAEVLAIGADLTDPDTPNRIAANVIKEFGRIDILINSAGASQGGIFWDIPDEVWDESFALKFMGTIRMMRAVLPSMRKNGYGRIVTVVGDTGKQPRARLLPGAAANAALLVVIKGLSDEVAIDGIAINAVNPGPTRTERIATLFANLSESTGRTLEDIESDFTDDAPMKTMGDPEDVARMIVLLASDVTYNMTGTSITTDGGRSHALPPPPPDLLRPTYEIG